MTRETLRGWGGTSPSVADVVRPLDLAALRAAMTGAGVCAVAAASM